VIPLILIAVGMGLSNGPASSASTACVPANQVGSASGVSNMARYVGAAVATALAATVYSTVTDNGVKDGKSAADALTNGLQATSWVMAVISGLGLLMALLMGKHQAPSGTIGDSAAAAAAHTHTLPTTATPEVPPVSSPA
jgi:MFS family permease